MENQVQAHSPLSAVDDAALAKPPSAPQNNLRLMVAGLVGFLAVALLTAGGVGVYRVYAKTATDPFTKTVARWLRLPAFKVNSTAITYTDYIDDLEAIKKLRTFEQGSGGQGAALTDEQLSDQVLLRLANLAVVAEAAAQYGVTVESADVAVLKEQILTQLKTVEAADAELQKRYGWDFATYQTKVMRPFVLQNKLAEKIQADPAARTAARAQAEQVLAELKNGKDFVTLAARYGQDGTAQNGGDLGWFGKGDMVPQFEAAAFTLKKGALSAEPVESPFGYHLIKVDDRRTTKAKDESGKTVSREEIKARHILLRFPGLDTYLQDALRKANFQLYLKVHNPFPLFAATSTRP